MQTCQLKHNFSDVFLILFVPLCLILISLKLQFFFASCDHFVRLPYYMLNAYLFIRRWQVGKEELTAPFALVLHLSGRVSIRSLLALFMHRYDTLLKKIIIV
jgi:hypothetical protein